MTTALGLVLAASGCVTTSETELKQPLAPGSEEQSVRATMLLKYCKKLYDAGDLYVAASICKRAFDTNPSDAAPLFSLAQIYGDLGAREQVAEAYRAALRINPDDIEALYGLAKTQIDAGNYQMAGAQLERALQLDDNDPRFYNALGIVKDQMGEHDVAQALYRTGLTIAPGSVSLRNNLGLSLTLSGDPSESIAVLRDVAREPEAGKVGGQNLALAARTRAKQTAENPKDKAAIPPKPRHQIEIRSAEGGDGAAGGAAMSKPLKKSNGAMADKSPRSIGKGSGDVAGKPSATGEAAARMPTNVKGPKAKAGKAKPAAQMAAKPKSKAAAKPKAKGAMARKGPYQVQLGAYGSQKRAERGWKVVRDSAKELLAELSQEVVKADAGPKKGTVYRLRAGPLASRADADKLCAKLTGRGVGCFVVSAEKHAVATAKPAKAAKAKDDKQMKPSADKAKKPGGKDDMAEKPEAPDTKG